MYRATCFGRLHAHHQELTATLTASGFTLERGGSSVVGRGLLPPRSKVKPEAVNAVVSSWWWAWRRPKHVERHKMSSNKPVKLLHLVNLFELYDDARTYQRQSFPLFLTWPFRNLTFPISMVDFATPPPTPPPSHSAASHVTLHSKLSKIECCMKKY